MLTSVLGRVFDLTPSRSADRADDPRYDAFLNFPDWLSNRMPRLPRERCVVIIGDHAAASDTGVILALGSSRYNPGDPMGKRDMGVSTGSTFSRCPRLSSGRVLLYGWS
jgi:hypothetical protein